MTGPASFPEHLAAALAERYRIQRELGRGGMATVYLAHDLKHDRKVAIKVLLPELSAVIGAERFLAEIHTTANLQHPHILPLFDSGAVGLTDSELTTHDSRLLFYVMPFVQGESLRARLVREKQLPVDDAVRIAREVASALDYAHRQGVVHRDIKPENILLHDGAALVADFGIALAVQQAGGSRLTQTGLSLGTPAYMSPEQAMAERDIGPRADVYALGAMTYEMLAGEPPFTGPTAQSIVAKVLTEQPPPLRTRRPLVSAAAEAAVLTALQKLPADRWGSAREFGEALDDGRVTRAVVASSRPAVLRWRRAILPSLLVLSALSALYFAVRPRPELPPSRLIILAPGVGGSGATAQQRHITFAPDGETLLYTALSTEGPIQLLRHRLDVEAPSVIPGAVNLASPVVAPDGRSFMATPAGRNEVIRFPIAGGDGDPIRATGVSTDLAAYSPDGTAWVGDVFGHAISRVSGDSVVSAISGTRGGIRLQQMLDNRTALVQRAPVGAAAGTLLLVDVETGREQPLLEMPVTEGRVIPGYLVTVQNTVLQAWPLKDRRVTGPSVTIATGVAVTGLSVAQFAVAANGTVAYIPEEPFRLVLVTRNGGTRLATPERRSFHHPMFSPNGRRLSVDMSTAAGRNVWVLDLAQQSLTRVTFEQDGHDATWTPDGQSILYLAPVTGREGTMALLRRRPGSAAPSETLFVSNELAYSGLALRDGNGVVTVSTSAPGVAGTAAATRTDIALLDQSGRGPLRPLVATTFAEAYPAVSPDGRWLAFASDQSGRDEVYLRDLLGEGEEVLVSNGGGNEPVWSPDGRELFYRETSPNPYLIAATVRTSPALDVGTRTRLFPIGEFVGTGPHPNYDVSPDGQTFAMVQRSPAARIVVIQNVPALVRRLQDPGATP